MLPSGSLLSVKQISPPVINILARERPLKRSLHNSPLCIAADKEEEFLLLGCSIIIGRVDVKAIPPDGQSAAAHDGSNS